MDVLKLRPEITNLIKNVSEKEGLHKYEIVQVQTNQKGEGYLGEIFMITLEDKSKSDKRLDIVIKAAFIDEKVREMVPIRLTFENEIYFYTKVFPAFEKLQGMKVFDEIIPRCFMVSKDNNQEMLALENLKNYGFRTFDKKQTLDEAHVSLIFQTYGQFHAYSYALRHKNPEEFAKLTAGLNNIFGEFLNRNLFQNYLIEINKVIESCFVPGEDDDIREKYNEKYSGAKIAEVFKQSVNEKCDFSAILHGDCWSNNMLFRYDKDGQPVNVRLIDFQIVNLGSPVSDLSYCLYSGASKKIYDNLNDYLQIYYDSFSKNLRKLGGNAEDLFPFHVLKEHWRLYSKFGMIMGFTIVKMKMTEKDDLVDFTDGLEMNELVSVIGKAKYNEEEYRQRIREIVRHMAAIDAL